MITYSDRGSPARHVLSATDARVAFAPVHAFLKNCTDCVGPLRVDGVPPDREERLLWPARTRKRATSASSSLDEVATVIDELVQQGQPCDLDLAFEFVLRDPTGQDHERFQYATRSFASLQLQHQRTSELWLSLSWPFDDISDDFLRAFDSTFETLELLPKRGHFDRSHVAFDFDRGAYAPPPDDDVGRALHEAVLASPEDEGPRTAYADWLTTRGDPLGEALVIQIELGKAGITAPRASQLRSRLRELRRKHGLRWSFVLVPP